MNVPEVIHSLELSALAYNDIKPPFREGIQRTVSDPDSDVQYYVRQIGRCLYITFRGSDSEEDWKTNLTFWKKTIPYGNTSSRIRVHAGFIDAYKSPKVRNIIHTMLSDDIDNVRITGHSQGAALAILCAVDLQYNCPDKDYEVIVFGSPRVGNSAFKKSYNKRVFKTIRVENGNDIVTKLPFCFMGYRHVGIKIHTGRPKIPGVFSFSDHRLQGYYSNLFKQFSP